MDYRKDTAYVVGGGARVPNAVDGNGNPVYQNQVYTQSQLNNNMSGTDANAIYQATHDPNFAAQYNQPYMQNFLADLDRMGLAYYNGQQRPDVNPGTYVTGAGATGMPSSIGTEQRLPRGYGSWEGLPNSAIPNSAEQAQYYADILNALTQSGGTTPQNQRAIAREQSMVRQGIL